MASPTSRSKRVPTLFSVAAPPFALSTREHFGVAAGRSLAEPVHYDGRPETEALKARYADWLKGN